MAGLIIKPRSRIFHGHDWVYSSEVKKAFGNPEPGTVVTLKDFKDRPLGSAIYNPESQIVARRISRRVQKLDLDLFSRRITRAQEYRESLGFSKEQPYRVVWSESDGLPGVVIDRYGDSAVLQTLTLAMDHQKQVIAQAATNVLGVTSVIERNDNGIRKAEGMEEAVGMLSGEAPGEVEVDDGTGIRFKVDLLGGQKTGLYLDQFGSYDAVAKHAKGRRVLDCFTNQGGFALHCARAGAASVEAVDISETAISATRENAALNSLAVETSVENVFGYLKALIAQEKKYDLIVLDPPSFTKAKSKINEAMRGYKEIHLRALKLLTPGGLMATFCCSHHVGWREFRNSVLSASVDAKKTLRQREIYTQRSDHPINATIPETEYLKGYLFEVTPSF
ncbi:class I SAM-dependent rRNA methyltransferase [Verrucomicrobiales bacterium]|nr:class I SAM-dependent rRNA methyltransferase [Verrucomicrobiales bacterium]